MKRLAPLSVLAFLLASFATVPIVSRAGAQSVSLKPCQFVKESSCTITASSTACPNSTPGNYRDPSNSVYVVNAAGQLEGRRYVTLCLTKNSANASALVTVRSDGTAPTTAATDSGKVLASGDCINLPVGGNYTPHAISTVNPSYVVATECSGG